MKLSICLLLAVVAAISADEDLAVDETESSGYVNEKFLRIINHQPPARTRQESGLMLLRNRCEFNYFSILYYCDRVIIEMPDEMGI